MLKMTKLVVVVASILWRSCRRLIRPLRRRWGRLVARLRMGSLYLVRLAKWVLVGIEVEVVEPGSLGAIHVVPVVAFEVFLH